MRGRWLGVCVGLGVAATATALAASSAPTTFEACIAKVKLAAKNSQAGTFYVSPRVSCLRPASLRTTASINFTTCPTDVKEEACIIGVQSISFTSRGSFPGTGSGTIPYGNDQTAVFAAVRGGGTFHCDWRYVEQVYGTVLERGTWDEPLTDQIVGFVGAANGGVTIGHGVYPSHFTSSGRTLRQPTATARALPTLQDPVS